MCLHFNTTNSVYIRVKVITMTNNEKLIEAFASALEIPADQVTDDLRYRSIKQWNSMAHMNLISTLEKTFDVMFETRQILNIRTVAKAREILAQEHGIKF